MSTWKVSSVNSKMQIYELNRLFTHAFFVLEVQENISQKII